MLSEILVLAVFILVPFLVFGVPLWLIAIRYVRSKFDDVVSSVKPSETAEPFSKARSDVRPRGKKVEK